MLQILKRISANTFRILHPKVHTFSPNHRLPTCVMASNSSSTSSEGTKGFGPHKVLDERAEGFLKRIAEISIQEIMPEYENRDAKVCEFMQPQELREKLGLDQLQDDPADLDTLMGHVKNAIRYSVKTGNSHFMNQLYSGVDPYSLGGAWLTSALNTNCHTFEVAPVFVMMEEVMVEKLCSYLGFKDGDGIFAPGGTMLNIYGVHLARYRANPKVKKEGLFTQQKMVFFTSEDSHYSLKTAAAFLGLGQDNCIKVKADARGRMDPADLEKCIEQAKSEGSVPFCVNATSGTTVLGAYDPIDDLASVCERHGMWLHVDACWGGACIVSSKLRHKMKGIERVDSVAWNLHKMIGSQLQTSALLVRHKGLMVEVNATRAEYLFQPDKIYDPSYDIGDKSIQCGRVPDALKLWVMWRAHGNLAITSRVERAFDNARHLQEKVAATEGFRLVMDEFECTNVCFWYVPPRLRGQPETPEWWQELGKVAPAIKGRMVQQGSLMIGYQPLPRLGLPNFFRVVISNVISHHADIDYILTEIERLGADL